MKLYLIAGHTKCKDEGAQNLVTKETENMVASGIVSSVFQQLKDKIPTEVCPFNQTLLGQIAWVNQRAKNEDFVVCCHLDSSPARKETGAMCYYYGGSTKSKQYAQKLIDEYCKLTGLKNKGVKADTASNHGRLGIIRDTIGWAFLIELGSINNDVEVVKSKAVAALKKAIKIMLNIL